MSTAMISLRRLSAVVLAGLLSVPVDARNIHFYSSSNYYPIVLSAACLPALEEAGFSISGPHPFQAVALCRQYNAANGILPDPRKTKKFTICSDYVNHGIIVPSYGLEFSTCI